MDAEALIGQVPRPWVVQQKVDDGYEVPYFFNPVTGHVSIDDPRLESLDAEWERIKVSRTPDDPMQMACFRNKHSGEIVKSDPRFSVEALTKHGVMLDKFRLV